MPTQALPDYLTADEVADRLKVRRSRVYDLIREGRLPGVARIGRQIRIDAQELREWLQAGGDAES